MGTNVQVDSASAECTQTMSGALMLIESLKRESRNDLRLSGRGCASDLR